MDTPSAAPYPYRGPVEWQAPIGASLAAVIDPEVAMSIVDVGLVYGVHVSDDTVAVDLTMTSAACPVARLIVEEVQVALDAVLPEAFAIDVRLVWDPPWTPARMSERGRAHMQW